MSRNIILILCILIIACNDKKDDNLEKSSVSELFAISGSATEAKSAGERAASLGNLAVNNLSNPTGASEASKENMYRSDMYRSDMYRSDSFIANQDKLCEKYIQNQNGLFSCEEESEIDPFKSGTSVIFDFISGTRIIYSNLSSSAIDDGGCEGDLISFDFEVIALPDANNPSEFSGSKLSYQISTCKRNNNSDEKGLALEAISYKIDGKFKQANESGGIGLEHELIGLSLKESTALNDSNNNEIVKEITGESKNLLTDDVIKIESIVKTELVEKENGEIENRQKIDEKITLESKGKSAELSSEGSISFSVDEKGEAKNIVNDVKGAVKVAKRGSDLSKVKPSAELRPGSKDKLGINMHIDESQVRDENDKFKAKKIAVESPVQVDVTQSSVEIAGALKREGQRVSPFVGSYVGVFGGFGVAKIDISYSKNKENIKIYKASIVLKEQAQTKTIKLNMSNSEKHVAKASLSFSEDESQSLNDDSLVLKWKDKKALNLELRLKGSSLEINLEGEDDSYLFKKVLKEDAIDNLKIVVNQATVFNKKPFTISVIAKETSVSLKGKFEIKIFRSLGSSVSQIGKTRYAFLKKDSKDISIKAIDTGGFEIEGVFLTLSQKNSDGKIIHAGRSNNFKIKKSDKEELYADINWPDAVLEDNKFSLKIEIKNKENMLASSFSGDAALRFDDKLGKNFDPGLTLIKSGEKCERKTGDKSSGLVKLKISGGKVSESLKICNTKATRETHNSTIGAIISFEMPDRIPSKTKEIKVVPALAERIEIKVSQRNVAPKDSIVIAKDTSIILDISTLNKANEKNKSYNADFNLLSYFSDNGGETRKIVKLENQEKVKIVNGKARIWDLRFDPVSLRSAGIAPEKDRLFFELVPVNKDLGALSAVSSAIKVIAKPNGIEFKETEGSEAIYGKLVEYQIILFSDIFGAKRYYEDFPVPVFYQFYDGSKLNDKTLIDNERFSRRKASEDSSIIEIEGKKAIVITRRSVFLPSDKTSENRSIELKVFIPDLNFRDKNPILSPVRLKIKMPENCALINKKGICESKVQDCEIKDGKGQSVWDEKRGAFSGCSVSSCDDGFLIDKKRKSCISENTDCSKEIKHSLIARKSQDEKLVNYGKCNLIACNKNYHKEGNQCVPDTRICKENNSKGRQNWRDSKWGPCNLDSCKVGFSFDSKANSCVPSEIECKIDNLKGKKIFDSSLNAYGVCQRSGCKSGEIEDKKSRKCILYKKECELSNGLGYQKYDLRSGSYSSCKLFSCSVGYIKDSSSSSCVKEERDCKAHLLSENAESAKEYFEEKEGKYSGCKATKCKSGYHIENGRCVEDSKDCKVLNGSGKSVWDFRKQDYGICKVVSCEAGYHKLSKKQLCEKDEIDCTKLAKNSAKAERSWLGNEEAGYGICKVKACKRGYSLNSKKQICEKTELDCSEKILNGKGASSFDPAKNRYSECLLTSCDQGFHLENGVCKKTSGKCIVSEQDTKAGIAERGRIGSVIKSGKDSCQVTKCLRGFHVEAGECKPDSRKCELSNGQGTQSWDSKEKSYTECKLSSCNKGFHSEDNKSCLASKRACKIDGSEASQTFKDGKWGECQISKCKQGFIHAKVSKKCVKEVLDCEIENAKGAVRSFDSSKEEYGDCKISSCDKGFHIENGECRSNRQSFSIGENGNRTREWSKEGGWSEWSYNCNESFHEEIIPMGPTKVRSCEADTKKCNIKNGSGIQTWDEKEKGYTECKISFCSKGFHEELGLCVSNQKRCKGLNGSGFQYWESAQKNDCICTKEYRPVCGEDNKTYGNKCEAKCNGQGISYEGACKVKERQREVQNMSNNGNWGACVLSTCEEGFVLDSASNSCKGKDKECEVLNGAGKKSFDKELNDYRECKAVECSKGYHLELGECRKNKETRSINNGSQSREWISKDKNSGWSDWEFHCDKDYHYEERKIGGLIIKQCVSDLKSCTLENGIGEKVWTDGNWSKCVIKHCNQVENEFEASYHIASSGDFCELNKKDCAKNNGTGQALWNPLENDYASCRINNCSKGYRLDRLSNSCKECVAEICDGLDNDCDGEIDEEIRSPLSNNQNGVCNGSLKICGGESGWLEPDYSKLRNYQSIESNCDGIDNDCDGVIDAGCRRACKIEYGEGEEIWNTSTKTWDYCSAVFCNSGFHIEKSRCKSNYEESQIENGFKHRKWLYAESGEEGAKAEDWSEWSYACDDDHHLEFVNDGSDKGYACKSNTKDCEIVNGSGSQNWDTSSGSWNSCSVTSCDESAYRSEDGKCLKISECGAGTFEAVPPTENSDRVCDAITECADDEYESKAASKNSDRVCEKFDVFECPKNQGLDAALSHGDFQGRNKGEKCVAFKGLSSFDLNQCKFNVRLSATEESENRTTADANFQNSIGGRYYSQFNQDERFKLGANETMYKKEQALSDLGIWNYCGDIQGRFNININTSQADKYIYDHQLKGFWSKKGPKSNYENAESYCKTLGEGWRLPSLTELVSLYSATWRSDSVGNSPVFDDHNSGDSTNFWTTTERAKQGGRVVLNINSRAIWETHDGSTYLVPRCFKQGKIRSPNMEDWCDDGFYLDSDNNCMKISECGAGTYELEPPTLRSDRVCAALTSCSENEYEKVGATSSSDRVCSFFMSEPFCKKGKGLGSLSFTETQKRLESGLDTSHKFNYQADECLDFSLPLNFNIKQCKFNVRLTPTENSNGLTSSSANFQNNIGGRYYSDFLVEDGPFTPQGDEASKDIYHQELRLSNAGIWNWCGDIEGRFNYNKYEGDNEYVYDNLLDAFWSRQTTRENSKMKTWEEAKAYCTDLGEGWQLPSIYELVSLFSSSSRADQVQTHHIFGDNERLSNNMWSSTISLESTERSVFGVSVNINSGSIYDRWVSQKYVRCIKYN